MKRVFFTPQRASYSGWAIKLQAWRQTLARDRDAAPAQCRG